MHDHTLEKNVRQCLFFVSGVKNLSCCSSTLYLPHSSVFLISGSFVGELSGAFTLFRPCLFLPFF